MIAEVVSLCFQVAEDDEQTRSPERPERREVTCGYQDTKTDDDKPNDEREAGEQGAFGLIDIPEEAVGDEDKKQKADKSDDKGDFMKKTAIKEGLDVVGLQPDTWLFASGKGLHVRIGGSVANDDDLSI